MTAVPDNTRERWNDEEALALRDKIAEATMLSPEKASEMAERLGSAFNWHDSPQGWRFWHAVTQALYALGASRSDRKPADRR